jgi:hypothetical protein
MFKKLKLFAIGSGLLLVTGNVFIPTTSSALFEGSTQEACEALNQTGGTPGTGCGTTSETRVTNLVKLVLNILSVVVGIAAVIMIIIAGLKYVTSQGDTASVGSAKNTLLYAVVGLVVVVMAQFIVRFVMKKVSP